VLVCGRGTFAVTSTKRLFIKGTRSTLIQRQNDFSIGGDYLIIVGQDNFPSAVTQCTNPQTQNIEQCSFTSGNAARLIVSAHDCKFQWLDWSGADQVTGNKVFNQCVIVGGTDAPYNIQPIPRWNYNVTFNDSYFGNPCQPQVNASGAGTLTFNRCSFPANMSTTPPAGWVFNDCVWRKQADMSNKADLVGGKVPLAQLPDTTYQESLTYAQLTAKISAATLVPGKKYLINDFRTTYYYYRTASATSAPVEPLIVTALSTNALSGAAVSTLYPLHRITYTINNVGYSSHGKIVYRIDTKNNQTPFDFVGERQNWAKMDLSQIPIHDAAASYSYGQAVRVIQGSNTQIRLYEPGAIASNWTSWTTLSSLFVSGYILNEYGIFVGGCFYITFFPRDYLQTKDVPVFCDANGDPAFDSPHVTNNTVSNSNNLIFAADISRCNNCKINGERITVINCTDMEVDGGFATLSDCHNITAHNLYQSYLNSSNYISLNHANGTVIDMSDNIRMEQDASSCCVRHSYSTDFKGSRISAFYGFHTVTLLENLDFTTMSNKENCLISNSATAKLEATGWTITPL
jgi:hypothetical protein